jgi:hypothetical protein
LVNSLPVARQSRSRGGGHADAHEADRLPAREFADFMLFHRVLLAQGTLCHRGDGMPPARDMPERGVVCWWHREDGLPLAPIKSQLILTRSSERDGGASVTTEPGWDLHPGFNAGALGPCPTDARADCGYPTRWLIRILISDRSRGRQGMGRTSDAVGRRLDTPPGRGIGRSK